jgi:alpha-beta hydrolase superfamily lysophospholipase
VRSIDQYLEEIDHLIQRAQTLYTDKRILLYGHSLGGMLVLRYALHRPPDAVTGIVASSPWLRLAFDPPAWKIKLGRLMRSVWPSMQQASGMEPKHLCTDPEVVAAYQFDPLVHARITPAAGLGIMDGAEELMAWSGGTPLPILIMHGEADQITSMEASRQFAAQNAGVEFKSWPGLYHEIHHEPNKIEVLSYAGNWFEGLRKASN